VIVACQLMKPLLASSLITLSAGCCKAIFKQGSTPSMRSCYALHLNDFKRPLVTKKVCDECKICNDKMAHALKAVL
jgi:hypothetical protein